MSRGVALVCALLAMSGCGAEPDAGGIGDRGQPIIGGAWDTGKDPAIGILIGRFPTRRVLCTASMITPRVVLTAAHCVNDAGGTWEIWFADSYDADTGELAGLLDDRKRVASKIWYDPRFVESNLAGGNDIALLLVDPPLPASIAPVAWNRRRLTAAVVGQSLRMVGFGHRFYASDDPLFVKLTASNEVTRFTGADQLEIVDSTHITCQGDSGGPAFVTIDGRETVAGITSYGDAGCSEFAGFTRVDLHLDDIAAFIAENDPRDAQACAADGACDTFCAAPDPDCPCEGDGSCPASCADPDGDPDCPLGCGQNGACVREGCPAKDPDCGDQATGGACTADDACASGHCSGESRVCVAACGAGASCPSSFTCSGNLCEPAPAGGCGCVAGRSSRAGAGWLALLAGACAPLLRRRRRGRRTTAPQ